MSKQASPGSRDCNIDILRGIAIFTMVAANLSAACLKQPPPQAFRFYGTFAAPLFMLIAGYMIAFNSERKSYNFNSYLKRGLIIISVGALIDVFGGYYPFISFDVLYLIGFSFPLVYLFNRLKTPQQIAIIFSIFAITPALQVMFGYNEYPVQVEIFKYHSISAYPTAVNILRNWLIEGWFPVTKGAVKVRRVADEKCDTWLRFRTTP
jgi:uncharacterized membrane protein